MGMAEPGGEPRDVAFDIDLVTTPPQQRVHGEPVAQVMQARTDAVRLRGSTQTDLLRQLCEGPVQRPPGDPGAAFGKEEGRDERMGTEAVAMSCIAGERLGGRCMHRQITRLAELAVAHAQHTAGEIDIVAVEVQHLAHPHPGDGQQPQHRGIGQGPQSGGAGEGSRRGDERGDFSIAE